MKADNESEGGGHFMPNTADSNVIWIGPVADVIQNGHTIQILVGEKQFAATVQSVCYRGTELISVVAWHREFGPNRFNDAKLCRPVPLAACRGSSPRQDTTETGLR